jgi:glycerol-3-phosphate O-acyltransferase
LAGRVIAGEVVQRVREHVLERTGGAGPGLESVLFETVYREQQRLLSSEGEPRAALDRDFVRDLRHDLARADCRQLERLLERVLRHYVEEICGHFDRRVYGFATRAVPLGLGALLHGGQLSRHLFDVRDRVLLEGELDALRWAARSGTVVLVPSHVSNLDSLILGYALFALDLPPFAYGAGLNLFTSAVTGFFMRNLGAFTVDRKKTDPLYNDTVKEYATVLLEHGQHMLFFPGGTRSRSGAIEEHLKLGFLGTAVSAFGARRRRDPASPPLFIVPCTLSYPLVLEGASLIDEYLRREGGPSFVDVRDEFERPERWFDFLRQLAQLDLQVHVRFGAPLDIVGNPVEVGVPGGLSRDRRGKQLDPVRYLYRDGAVVRDPERDAEYTRLLAVELTHVYRREVVALPSSVLAYVAFAQLRRKLPELDVLRLLRVLGPLATLSIEALRPELEHTLRQLDALAARGEIRLAPELRERGVDGVLEGGARTLSRYHRVPVLTREGPELHVSDPALLLYYRNRLAGYGLSEPLTDRAGLRSTRPARRPTP